MISGEPQVISQIAALDLPSRSDHSRYAQRVRRRHNELLDWLAAGAPTHATIAACVDRLMSAGHPLAVALRIARQLVMERLIRLDCDCAAPLDVVTRAMTDLAELALELACTQVRLELDALHGPPLVPGGTHAQFWVVGMGKLGARELNVSSDIDLVYLYDHDGDTQGSTESQTHCLNRISNQEYFAKLVRGIYALVGEPTEHGFVFRLDLALRPNGNAGPPAMSLAALEEYFHVQGREWERFAWLKSRVIVPTRSVADGSAATLRPVVLPFVFRRYLDYGVFEALRVLHQQIRNSATKRSAGRPDRANDVKLSRGGIREIEFTVQLLQVVRGGQFPELRTRPTLSALRRLSVAGLMPDTTAQALGKAYVFLRQVEHRIQYLDDQQTHVLPTCDIDLAWIAQTLGLPGTCAFLSQLDLHREVVAHEFDTLLRSHEGGGCKSCSGPRTQSDTGLDSDAVVAQLEGVFRARIEGWREHTRVAALREDSAVRLWRLVARTGQWLKQGRVSDAAAVQWVNWTEALLRRESYLALLLERPQVHERLLRLLGTARWPARYLLLHPGVIDELASDRMLHGRFDAATFLHELEQRRASLKITGEDDEEALLNLLRRAHHAEVFRTLARDVEGELGVEQVADELSALAGAVLHITTQWCWERLAHRHCDAPRVGIIGYGKLGGKELGYGSDLDIVFVYDDDDERAPEVYAVLVRKLINWLTVKTGEGDLYEIDTALRPNGNSGLLVSTLNAFSNYQLQRGGNSAWAWEHQAMTRARLVLGDEAMQLRFDAIRAGVIGAVRNTNELRTEINAMRQRLRASRPVPSGRFDVKHSPGGMVDAEFVVQFLVLTHASQHPILLGNIGNIALLQGAETLGLLTPDVGEQAARAYRALRQIQHTARLNEEPTQVPPAQCALESAAILALWHEVMEQAQGAAD